MIHLGTTRITILPCVGFVFVFFFVFCLDYYSPDLSDLEKEKFKILYLENFQV